MLLRRPLERVVGYTLRQISDIDQGGLTVLFEKVKQRAIILLLVLSAMPFIVIVRLLRPLITIRFDNLKESVSS